MKISDVRIRLIKKEGVKMKAVASITLEDAFAVHDIKIIESDNELFIAMPSRKTSEGDYKDIAHPLNNQVRDQIKEAILGAYKLELCKS